MTVCNLNQFRYSKLREVEIIQEFLRSYSNKKRNKSDGSNFEESLNRLRKMLKKDLASDKDDDDLDVVEVDESLLLEQLVAITASFYNQTHLKQVGHQFKDMILSCSWKGVNCRTGYNIALYLYAQYSIMAKMRARLPKKYGTSDI